MEIPMLLLAWQWFSLVVVAAASGRRTSKLHHYLLPWCAVRMKRARLRPWTAPALPYGRLDITPAKNGLDLCRAAAENLSSRNHTDGSAISP